MPWAVTAGHFVCLEKDVVSGATLMQCVSVTGTCECSDKSIELGLSTPCSVESVFGTCESVRVCTDDGLSACLAGDPVAEVCNGLDDDCDVDVDEETCDDENPCTDDVCNGADGCEYIALNYIECLDGDLCTVSDICEQGIFVGTPMDCDDGNVCTDDMCDPATGSCVYDNNMAPCDDLDPCTVADQCLNGACAGVAIDCDCVVDDDCGKLEDGDLCNGILSCDTAMSPYLCKVDLDTLVDCLDPEGPDAPCLASVCDPETGECDFADDNEGFPCDDEDLCTIADFCEKGECIGGTSANCNDGNVCTDDLCEPEVGCIPTPNTAPCEDGDICTVGDQCEGGECIHGPEISCDDGTVCTDDACDSDFGCVYTNNVAPCDDGNPCTMGDHCVLGLCESVETDTCDDANPCTTDYCDPATGCVHEDNTLPCNDADVCTIGDVCADGVCVGGVLLSCNDGNLCTDDSCDNLSGCQYVANSDPCDDQNTCTISDMCVDGECVGEGSLDCDDANPCTKDICLPGGGCDHEDILGSCTDGDPCTLNDSCQAGQCVPGPALDCDDGNPCTDDECALDGSCSNTANTASCDDGNACTEGDHCADGSCVHAGLLDCDDDDVCTTDSCNPVSGCVSTNNTVPCDDGNACTTGDVCSDGSCVSAGTLDCDDNNPCTDDECDAQDGCQFAANEEQCDDLNACSDGDYCADGLCHPGDMIDCDDGNPCTDDYCTVGEGCQFVPNQDQCDDLNACSDGDFCAGGECQSGPPLECNDSNACTGDECVDDEQCGVALPFCHQNSCVQCTDDGHCDDGDPCTFDTCLPELECENASAGPGAPCGDGKFCTIAGECLWLVGTGADGDLVVSGAYLLDVEGLAPAYPVVGVAGEGDHQVTLAEAPSGIVQGDEVIIVNLQGTVDDHGAVGLYEFGRVAVVDGVTLTLEDALGGSYEGDSQKVVVQRVPNFDNVTVMDGGVLTSSPWNGQKGGIVAFRVYGALTVNSGGRVDASALGYRQGNGSGQHPWGSQGEGVAGPGAFANEANYGGGGGAISDEDGMGGGGGAYSTAGTQGASTGTDFVGPGGQGAEPYGEPELSHLHLGGGGGQAGGDQYGPLLDHSGAGRGAGIVWMAVANLVLEGTIEARGQAGKHLHDDIYQRDGGGGAGGSIYLTVVNPSGSGSLDASGGPGGSNGGGNGGEGRVRIDGPTGDSGLNAQPAAFEQAY